MYKGKSSNVLQGGRWSNVLQDDLGCHLDTILKQSFNCILEGNDGRGIL